MPGLGDIQVASGCFSGSLLESVQDIDAFRESREVEDSMFKSGVNPNLLNPGAHARHGLVVIRLEAGLDPSELEADRSSGVRWERSDVFERASDPDDRLHMHGLVYKYRHVLSTTDSRESPPERDRAKRFTNDVFANPMDNAAS